MRLQINIKKTFLANMLIIKTHQTLTVEIGLSVLNHPIQKDSDENMNSFSNLRPMVNILLVLFSKGTLSDAQEGVTSKKLSLAPLASSEPSYNSYQQQLSYLGSYIFVLLHEIHIQVILFQL